MGCVQSVPVAQCCLGGLVWVVGGKGRLWCCASCTTVVDGCGRGVLCVTCQPRVVPRLSLAHRTHTPPLHAVAVAWCGVCAACSGGVSFFVLLNAGHVVGLGTPGMCRAGHAFTANVRWHVLGLSLGVCVVGFTAALGGARPLSLSLSLYVEGVPSGYPKREAFAKHVAHKREVECRGSVDCAFGLCCGEGG